MVLTPMHPTQSITPLIKCITNNALNYAKFLMKKDANTCNHDSNAYTPLAWAVYNYTKKY